MRERLIKLGTHLVWAAIAACVLGALGGWLAAQYLHIPQVDSMRSFRPASTTHIYDSDGNLVASFAIEQRVELKPEQIPKHLKQAIVAAEDAKFYEHGGVDPKAIARAVWGSIKARRLGGQGGGSTLTQQLALDLFLQRERTLTRKAKEALLAIDIEKRYSKDQIITMYANQIFLGHGAYGVEAAAKLYYNKTALELTVPEAALLAGIIPSASNKFDPIRNPKRTKERRDWVLRRMLELGNIDEKTCMAAIKEPLGVALHRDTIDTGAYFVEYVRQKIEQQHGTDGLYTAGREIHLTMDRQLQEAADEAVREELVTLSKYLGFNEPALIYQTDDEEDVKLDEKQIAAAVAAFEHPSWESAKFEAAALVRAVVVKVEKNQATVRFADRRGTVSLASAKWTKTKNLKKILKPGHLIMVRLPESISQDPSELLELGLEQEPEIEASLLAMDNRTGAVLAMVGGFDFGRSEFNRAMQSTLQCGSTFKPFVYLTAIKQGFSPSDMLFDAPFLLPDSSGKKTYCPKNYKPKYNGMTTVRRALELSYNASAVKLQALVGGNDVIETAKNFGISTELRPYASLALGTLSVYLVDLVKAYAGFANLGEVPEPYVISEIYDRDGRLEERFFPYVTRSDSSPAHTYLLLSILKGVVHNGGTGYSAAKLGGNLAGKTGTTDDYSDAWFVGSSPRITVGVWVGRDKKAAIGRRMTGAKAAQPIWNRFMKLYLETLTEEQRAEDFPVPPGVVFAQVDRNTGKIATPLCTTESKVITEAFLDSAVPTHLCTAEDHEKLNHPWPFQIEAYTPRAKEVELELMPSKEALDIAEERFRKRNR